MRTMMVGAAALLGLAGCHSDVDWSTDETANGSDVALSMRTGEDGDRMSVKLPILNADIALPKLQLGENMDLNGMKLAPGTRVRNLDVTDKDTGGEVRIGFSSPQGPPELIAYYKAAAASAGYRDIQAGMASLKARKADDSFSLMLRPEGAGSGGTITITDRN
jgi:hypothetical protein